MTIQRGQEWGVPITVKSAFSVLNSDQQLQSTAPDEICFMASGDIATTVGSPSPPTEGDTRRLVDIDAILCTVHFTDGTTKIVHSGGGIFIGTLLRPFPAQQRLVVVTNTGLHRGCNYAPRAHPNDGKFDVVQFGADMSLRERVMAKNRLGTGTHVPHPKISVQQHTEFRVDRQTQSERLLIDDMSMSHWRSIEMSLLPDYWKIIV